MKKLLLVLMLAFAIPCSFAYDKDYTLVLTILNHTKDTLMLTHVTTKSPNSQFTWFPQKDAIQPGDTGVVIAETVHENDLRGDMHFSDSNSNDHIIIIKDPRQFHNVPTVLKVGNNDKFTSSLKNITRSSEGTNGLRIISAQITISDKNSPEPN